MYLPASKLVTRTSSAAYQASKLTTTMDLSLKQKEIKKEQEKQIYTRKKEKERKLEEERQEKERKRKEKN